MLKRTLIPRALLVATVIALPGCQSHAPSWDFLQRLSEPDKTWTLDCAEKKSAPFVEGAKLQFHYDSVSLSLRVDGEPVALENTVRAGMKRLRDEPAHLACKQPHALSEQTTARLHDLFGQKQLDCEAALPFIDPDFPPLEHVSASYHDGSVAKCVYFFLRVPNDSDSRRDELLIKIFSDEGGVGENSVHGGPPN
jgi:hypothetical protein